MSARSGVCQLAAIEANHTTPVGSESSGICRSRLGDSKMLLERLAYVQATASDILDGIEEKPQEQTA
jgi:hypothetical protein